jgi:glucose/arabinose dehydrogenase
MPARALFLILIAAALLAACSSGPRAASPTSPAATDSTSQPTLEAAAQPTQPPSDEPTSASESEPTVAAAATATAAPPVAAGELAIGLELIAEDFANPTHVTSANDGSGRLFVVEQAGRIWIVRDGAPLAEPFLDIIPLVGSNGNEQGLLSVAFHPAFAENGRFFVGYTDRDGKNTVASYSVAADTPDRADAASGSVLIAVEDPAPNHNGGLLKFGPDGYLYVGMGDGGAAGDPWGNAQNLDVLLGKMLRLDVDNGEPYASPPDNPFVGQEGARPEIWAYGLRNPWRYSFDRETGDLFIADVGQNEFEEVHFQPAASAGGENYGWDIVEGEACYDAGSCDQESLVPPVAVYPHSGDAGGCSITGGYVYRGSQFPQLAGTYLYADYCSGNLWALRQGGDSWQNELVTTLDIRASSFGEDEAGELYLTDRDGGGLYRLVVQ